MNPNTKCWRWKSFGGRGNPLFPSVNPWLSWYNCCNMWKQQIANRCVSRWRIQSLHTLLRSAPAAFLNNGPDQCTHLSMHTDQHTCILLLRGCKKVRYPTSSLSKCPNLLAMGWGMRITRNYSAWQKCWAMTHLNGRLRLACENFRWSSADCSWPNLLNPIRVC